jgi:hypothetical protein
MEFNVTSIPRVRLCASLQTKYCAGISGWQNFPAFLSGLGPRRGEKNDGTVLILSEPSPQESPKQGFRELHSLIEERWKVWILIPSHN